MVNTNETIMLKQMIEEMDKGVIFSIGFRTCNLQKNTGGEYIFFDACVKHNHQTPSQLKERKESGQALQKVHRNPNHFENSTRNIKRLSSGELIKVHIRLIRQFNGKIVT